MTRIRPRPYIVADLTDSAELPGVHGVHRAVRIQRHAGLSGLASCNAVTIAAPIATLNRSIIKFLLAAGLETILLHKNHVCEQYVQK